MEDERVEKGWGRRRGRLDKKMRSEEPEEQKKIRGMEDERREKIRRERRRK